MSSRDDDSMDMTNIQIDLETNASDAVKPTGEANNIKLPENESATPLEDRLGRSLWVQTRMCYCPDNAETDCRFHSQEEKGWEKCPHTELSIKNRHVKGRWLWARNPVYGKSVLPEETTTSETKSELLPVVTN